jgi:hypothetical protein
MPGDVVDIGAGRRSDYACQPKFVVNTDAGGRRSDTSQPASR